MLKQIKNLVLMSCIIALSFIALSSTSTLPSIVPPIQVDAATVKPSGVIDEIIKKLRDYLGDLKISNKEPKLNEGESLIILKEKSGMFRNQLRYLVINQDQSMKLNSNPMLLEEIAQQYSLKLKITIACEGSYPPLKIKCTITISW
jgi:hypothetical protein